MTKRRLMPKGHWDWSLPITLSQGWKTGDLVFVGGQISADAKGRTVAAGDVETQARNVMEFIRRVLAEAGATMADVVKHNVYYVWDGTRGDLPAFLGAIDRVRAEYFKEPGPVATETPVAGLAYEGLLLEIEAIAYVGRDKQRLAPKGHWNRSGAAPYSHGWRCGEWVFVGGQRSFDGNGRLKDARDIAAQTRNCFEGMARVLAEAGADMTQLTRLNTYYDFEGSGQAVTGFWEKMTKVRMEYLPNPGPSGTAVRVSGFANPGELFQIEGIAHLGRDRKRLMPKGHWDWSMPVPFSQGWRVGNVVFCGGQISADARGRTVGAGDIEIQTKHAFEFIGKVLAEGGAEMSDVVKLNTYYHYEGEGRDVTDYWERMTKVRKRYLPPQGPSATAVRVKGYAYEDLLIEVEAIAVIDR